MRQSSLHILKLGFTLFLLVLSTSLIAQSHYSYSFQEYNTDDGLPSPEIHDILQDSAGFIWLGTTSGLVKYDGYNFHTFSFNDQLVDNSVVKMYLDNQNRIWFGTFNGMLCRFDNGQLKVFPHNDKLPKGHEADLIANIFIDKDSLVWLTYFNHHGLYTLDSQEKYTRINPFPEKDFEIYALYFTIKENNIVHVRKKDPILQNSTKLQEFSPNSFVLTEDLKPPIWTNHICVITHQDSLIFFTKDTRLFKYNRYTKRLVYKEYGNATLKVFIDSKNCLWLNIMGNGVYRYQNADINSEPEKLLNNYTISNVFEDNQGNYWFTTSYNGLLFSPGLGIKTYFNESIGKQFTCDHLEIHNGKLVFSEAPNKLHVFKDDQLEKKQTYIQKNRKGYFKDLLITQDGQIWPLRRTKATFTVEGEKRKKPRLSKANYTIHEISKDSLAFGLVSGFSIIYKNEEVYYSGPEFTEKVFSIYVDDDKVFWIGTLRGLWKYKDGEYFDLRENNLYNTRISNITGNKKLTLVGTHTKGIFCHIDSYVITINKNDGLSQNQINKLFIESDSVFWAATNTGLNRISVTGEFPYTVKVRVFTEVHGLPSKKINDLDIEGNTLWIATQKGIGTLDLNASLPKLSPIKLFLESFIAGDDTLAVYDDLLVVAPAHNDINISVKALCYGQSGEINYKYRLEGFDKNWKSSISPVIRYTSLPPGKYTLYVVATNFDGNSDQIVKEIQIEAHFTQKLWFFILIYSLGFGILIYIFHLILRTYKRRSEIRQQLLLSEQKALSSQMNPHFIFNSLNSIQSFILNSDIDASQEYLVNFAVLIRKTLENSHKRFIPLEEELDVISLYVKLEQLRFNPSFNFTMETDPKINPKKFMVPPMLIQPLIENSIWHGLSPSSKEKSLNIRLKYLDDTQIECEIEDNGIGREASLKNKRALHKSRGIANTEERIRLLNESEHISIDLKILDLKTDENNPVGTKAVLRLNSNID